MDKLAAVSCAYDDHCLQRAQIEGDVSKCDQVGLGKSEIFSPQWRGGMKFISLFDLQQIVVDYFCVLCYYRSFKLFDETLSVFGKHYVIAATWSHVLAAWTFHFFSLVLHLNTL